MLHFYPRQRWANGTMKVIVHANSIGAGTGSSNMATKAYPPRLKVYAPVLGTDIVVENRSVAGQSIITKGTAPSTLVATMSTAVVPNLATDRPNLVIVHELVNELVQNSNNVSTAVNGLWTYCDNLKAAAASAGAKVQILLLTVEAGRAGTQTDAQILARNNAAKACNVRLRNEFRQHADYLCDMARHWPWSAIEAGGDYSAAVFAAYNSQTNLWTKSDGTAIDYLHYGDVGYDYRAQLIARALMRVRPQYSAPAAGGTLLVSSSGESLTSSDGTALQTA